MKLLRAAVVAYAIATIVALGLIPASALGWLDERADALATLFSLALALPWTPVLLMVPGQSPWIGAALLAGAACLNLFVAILLVRCLQAD